MAVEIVSPTSVAGITQGERFTNFHSITDARIARAIDLANLHFLGRGQSVENMARSWLIVAGDSADCAHLADRNNGDYIVIIRKYEFSFPNPRLSLVDGQLRFETQVSAVDPQRKKAFLDTEVLFREEVVAKTTAHIVLSPTFVSGEDRIRLARLAERAKANIASKTEASGNSLQLSRILYEVSKKRGRLVAELSGDDQFLHDPNRWVRLSPEGQVLYEDGRVMTYVGKRQGQSDKVFGELTRFGRPIAHGVLSALPTLVGFSRLEKFASGLVVTIEEGKIEFMGPVGYGSTLMINETITGIEPYNTEQRGRERFNESKVGLEVMCSTEQGECIRGKFIVKLS